MNSVTSALTAQEWEQYFYEYVAKVWEEQRRYEREIERLRAKRTRRHGRAL